MTALWICLPFVVEAAAIGGAWLLARAGERADMRAETRLRSGSPSGAVDGIGVERTPAAPGQTQVPAALPRSPQSPAGGAVDPRPTAPPVGPGIPAATVVAPRAVAAGLQRRRVVIHG